MITIRERAAIAAVLVGLAFPALSSAQDLQPASNQPTISGSLGQGYEGNQKASVSSGDSGVYIIQLGDPSLAVYGGGINGMAATSAKANGDRRLNLSRAASQSYGKFLRGKQNAFVADCEAALGHKIDVSYNYQTVFNGVAMTLTKAEADIVAAAPSVKSMSRERMEVPLTDVGPQWIEADSIWGGHGHHDSHSMGEDVVIAILDTGINSDHPSYADIGGDGYDHTNPLGSGNYIPGSHCDANPGFCNDKLIGAWSFVAEAVTPEDSDGHGSHTAATAGGNVVPGATLGAPTTQLTRDISGVAPHANLIMYDVCIDDCPGAALLAAINQVVIDAAALPDGIHSLNYSISGGGNPYSDPVELGFLNATAAGVYVSASAGNAGPGPSTVAHLGPWVSTTAASTHNRTILNNVVDMTSDGASLADITGLGLTSEYGPQTIINSADLEGAFPGSTLCGVGALGDFIPPWPPGTFNGEIVACTRGTFGRVEKGANALSAGAGGYILMDNGAGLVGDAHVLPGVHITQADGAVLAAWLAGNTNPTGSISGYGLNLDDSNGDIMAGFSSRGPNLAFGVLKPDLTAPGVSIFAAEADGQALIAPEYQFLSGTSMSSPHNAGAGALMSAVQPDWTPYQIRSALMMTSNGTSSLKEDGMTPADPFDVGAGRIDLSRAPKAGLVLDETVANFEAADPALGGDPTTLNIASMQNNNCVGTCSWTRTVENVTHHSARWDLDTSGDAGLELSTDPGRKLKLKKGKTKEITVTADTSLAAPGWNFGTLELDRKGNGPDLHMPVAVFAATSSNPNVLSKTVDAATAAEGEPLNYEINITNGDLTGVIELSDALPDGLDFVAGSETEVVTNGSTISPFANSGGQLTWSGMLDPGGFGLGESATSPAGYLPLSLFFGPTPPPSGCDDGGYGISGMDFFYKGEHHTTALWSVNGTLEAGQASGVVASAGNQNLPSPSTPNNIMAPWWTDLNLCEAGNWYFGGLTDGVNNWTIFEWEDVPRFGDLTETATFQIWIQDGTDLIWFTYAGVDGADGTVGIENSDGTVGESRYFDGAGTHPNMGPDLEIQDRVGGTATFAFQAEIDDCKGGEGIVNRANISADNASETAIAVTLCVDDDGDSDSDSDSHRRR